MTTPAESPSLNQAARRKLVRGVFAAPAVLTVSSGASAAVKSNMRCVSNQVTDTALLPKSYPAGTAVPASAIRIPLWEKGNRYFFSGTDLSGLAHPSRAVTWLSVGQWHEFDMVQQQKTGSPMLESDNALNNKQHNGKYVNVLMDQQGYIVGVGKHVSGSNSMMVATCWNSFRAGPV
jgi:hypothetical protein